MFEKLKARNVALAIWCFLAVALAILTDPDNQLIHSLPLGAGLIATITVLLRSFLYVAIYHICRKILFDYIDLEAVYNKVMADKSSVGIGLFVVAVAIIMLGCALLISASV